MFDRLRGIAHGAGDLLRAEAEIALTQARRAGTWGAVTLASAAVGLIGLVGLVVAGTAALAMLTGWVAALAITSVTLVLAGVGAVAVSRHKLSQATERQAMPQDLIARAAVAKAQIAGNDTMTNTSGPSLTRSAASSGSSNSKPGESFEPKDAAAKFIAKNPGLALGGIAAAAALLGPSKTIKLVGRGMLIVSIATKVTDHLSDSQRTPMGQHAQRRAP